MCHNLDNMMSLRLASGETVPITESHRLCFQCHSTFYNLWDDGTHYANKTLPTDENFKMVPSLRSGWEENWKKENTCINCHNPHNPNELYQLPDKTLKMTKPSVSYIYIAEILIGIMIVTMIILLVLTKYYKVDLKKVILSSSARLSKFKLSQLKLKLPKISIPVSISIDEEDSKKVEEKVFVEEKPIEEKIEQVEEKIEEKVFVEEKPIEVEEKPIDRIDDKLEQKLTKLIEETKIEDKKKMFLHRYRGDILFILGIIVMFGTFYIIFGSFMPIVVAISESMSPHMEKGDMIFYTDISRINEIKTFDKNGGYRSFDDYGYVILYRPFGQEGVVPYIHRAMYYVNKGEEMWPGGPAAPHDGYITKGDNVVTNTKYDQQLDLSYNQPVKKEWIVGIARFRIPYIGYIRMLLP